MPTPEIDNIPEQIDVSDQLPTADQVPDTLTTTQASETLTSGTENPQPQIEQKVVSLVEVLNRLQNLTVEAFFAANPSDNDAIAEQRVYFKENLTIDTEADNLLSAGIKLYALNTFLGIDLSALEAVYPIPVSTVANIALRGKPQLALYFVETNYLIDSGRDIADAQIKGIRLTEFTSETIKESDLTALAEKVKSIFSDSFEWKKGKSLLSYSDPDKGYNLQIYCQSKDDGRQVIEKVLAIRDHEIEAKRLNYKENDAPEEAYPDTGSQIEILNKSVKTIAKRPICTVGFKVAFVHIDGLVKPKVLFDKTGKYQGAYVSPD